MSTSEKSFLSASTKNGFFAYFCSHAIAHSRKLFGQLLLWQYVNAQMRPLCVSVKFVARAKYWKCSSIVAADGHVCPTNLFNFRFYLSIIWNCAAFHKCCDQRNHIHTRRQVYALCLATSKVCKICNKVKVEGKTYSISNQMYNRRDEKG